MKVTYYSTDEKNKVSRRYSLMAKCNRIFGPTTYPREENPFAFCIQRMLEYKNEHPESILGFDVTGYTLEPEQLRKLQKEIPGVVIIPRLW